MIAFLRRHWIWLAVAVGAAVYWFLPRTRTVGGTITVGDDVSITYRTADGELVER